MRHLSSVQDPIPRLRTKYNTYTTKKEMYNIIQKLYNE